MFIVWIVGTVASIGIIYILLRVLYKADTTDTSERGLQ